MPKDLALLKNKLHSKVLELEQFRKDIRPLIRKDMMILAIPISLAFISILGAFGHQFYLMFEEDVFDIPQWQIFLKFFICWFIVPIILTILFNPVHERWTKNKNAFKQSYKEKLVRPMITHLAPDMSYSPEKGIQQSDFTSSHLFHHTPNIYHTEDLIVGNIGKTHLQIAEIGAKKKTTTGSGKNRKTTITPIFHGIFVIADFHKNFNNTTFIMPRGKRKPSSRITKRVTMESPTFEKNFDVYSNNAVEARYLLSLAMLERIVALQKKFNYKISFAFNRDLFYIAIESGKHKDMLDTSINKPINEALLEEFYTDLNLCFDIVEDLNLNTRIWSKITD